MLGGLAAGLEFAWFPTGDQILYQDRAGKILAVTVSDEPQPDADQELAFSGFLPRISPDGSWVALGMTTGPTEVREIPSGRLAFSVPNAGLASWSPDGRFLAVSACQERFCQIDLVSPWEQTRRVIVEGSRRRSYFLDSWSSTGSYLLVTTTLSDEIANGLAEKFFVVDVTSGKLEPLVNQAGCQQTATWAPDGRRVAFAGNLEDTWDLFSADLGTGTAPASLVRTAGRDEYQPSWSPKGDLVAYVAYTPDVATRTFEQDIYLVDVQNKGERRLTATRNEHESFPQWSPTGEWIAYFSFDGGTWYLKLMRPDGSDPRVLAVVEAGE